MSKVLYTHGDSVVWGAELEDKETERFSYHIAKHFDWIDCNNATAGVSNDYIYRQTIRDVSRWLSDKTIWSEETGWVKSDELIVVIGWTAPTRFEWWNGIEYQQERLWTGYDKWGENDKDRTTEDQFVLNQTDIIPSYIKTFNHLIVLSAFLSKYKIPYYFFNTFYQYELPTEPLTKIDKFGKLNYQTDLGILWNELPNDFKKHTMYDYNFKQGHIELLPRNHPSVNAHLEWANFIINELE
jgi:hypothetical protein